MSFSRQIRVVKKTLCFHEFSHFSVLYGTPRLDNSAKFTQAILETSCPSPSRQTSAPSFQARVTHRQK